jgi:hypothetical protein
MCASTGALSQALDDQAFGFGLWRGGVITATADSSGRQPLVLRITRAREKEEKQHVVSHLSNSLVTEATSEWHCVLGFGAR